MITRKNFIKGLLLTPFVRLPEIDFPSTWTIWETGEYGNIDLIKDGKLLVKNGEYNKTRAQYIREGSKGDREFFITTKGKTHKRTWDDAYNECVKSLAFDYCVNAAYFFTITTNLVLEDALSRGLKFNNLITTRFIFTLINFEWNFDGLILNNGLDSFYVNS